MGIVVLLALNPDIQVFSQARLQWENSSAMLKGMIAGPEVEQT